MPLYEKGGHTIDCPPIFRCRDHKRPLSFSESFCDTLMAYAESHVPNNLPETMHKHLGKRIGYLLPENLANPKTVLYNPNHVTGADALPFVTCRVNNRFVAIPSRYLTANQFDGCAECSNRQGRLPAPQEAFPQIAARPPRPRGENQEMRRREPRTASNRHMPTTDVKHQESQGQAKTSWFDTGTWLDKETKSNTHKPNTAKAPKKTMKRSPTQTMKRSPTQTMKRSPTQTMKRSPTQTMKRSPTQTMKRSNSNRLAAAQPASKTQPPKKGASKPSSSMKTKKQTAIRQGRVKFKPQKVGHSPPLEPRPPVQPEAKPVTPHTAEPKVEDNDGIQLRDHA